MSFLSASFRMVHYMAWANDITLNNASQLSRDEIHAPRDTLFKSIAGTFDHILVVEEIFLAHLEGRKHNFTARYRDTPIPFEEITARLREIDAHYIQLARKWSDPELQEVIKFEFVDGGSGEMSREDILLHLVTHSNYHRGFISTLLYPFKLQSKASDYPVFLRDQWPKIQKMEKRV